MKKLSAVLLALVLVVSSLLMTSCNETTTKIFNDAMAKTADLDSCEVKMTMNVKAALSGMTMEIPMTYDVKMAGLKTEKPTAVGTMGTSVLGQEISANVYDTGDYLYISGMGQSLKVRYDDSLSDYKLLDTSSSVLTDIPEEYLQDIVFTEDSSGAKSFELVLTDEQFKAMYADMLTELAGDVGTDAAEAGDALLGDMIISDVKLKVTITKDGYIGKFEVDCKVSMTQSMGELGTLDMTMELGLGLEYINPGTEVTVTPPEGYESFTEVNPDEVDIFG